MQRYCLRSPEYHRPHVSLSVGFPDSVCFLGNPSTGQYPVDTSSLRRTAQGYSVPEYCLPLGVGPHCSPGDVRGCSLEHAVSCPAGESDLSRVSMSVLDQANNPRRLAIPDDDSSVSSSAYPYLTLLGGMRGWIPRDRLWLPLHGLRVSRYRGEPASLLHLEERNYTSTALKLSKTSAVLAPHPRCFHLSRKRIAGRHGKGTPIAP